MPWLLMSRGYVPASQSVLLDYISPWSVMSLIKAARKKHFLVVLAISGAILIKLAIVFVTGLFSISTVEIAYTTPFVLESSFNNSANFGDPANLPFHDGFPILKAYSINLLNVTPQLGVNSDHVFPVFHDSNGANGKKSMHSIQIVLTTTGLSSPYESSYSYQATVDILTTDLSCEQANATAVLRNQSVPVLTLKSQSCSIDMWVNAGAVTTVIQLPVDGYSFQYVLWGCNDGALYEGYAPCEESATSSISDDSALWVFFTVPQSDDSVGSFEFPQLNTNGSTTMVLQHYFAMACQPNITTSRGQVTIRTDPSTGNLLSEVTIQEATEIPALAVNSSSLPLPVALLTQAYCSESSSLESTIDNPLLLANTTQDLPSLSDPNVLSANLRVSIGSTMAQAAKKYLMAPTNGIVQGTVIKPDVRLVIQPVSFAIIIAALCLAIINSLALLLIYTPCRVTSRDPASIGGLATILARSKDASASFQGTGSLSEESLSQLLTGEKYHARIGDQGDFLITHQGENVALRNLSEEANIEWWNPFSLSIATFIITLLLPISLIAILEALMYEPEKYDGIATVNDQSYMRYLWKFLPALAILAVQTLFEMISSSVRVIQPYHMLRQGHAPKSVIMENQQRKLAIWAFFDALFNRRWALIFAIFPVLLAPFLPISISGLYTTSSTIELQPVNVTQLDFFNFSSPYYIGVDSVGSLDYLIPDFVLMLNLSYPQWTYEKYAISKIEIPPSVESTGATGGNQLSVAIPAAYVDMNCSVVLSDQYQVVKDAEIGWTLLFQNLGPENCQFSTNVSSTYPVVKKKTPAEYWSLSIDASQQVQVPDGCPTVMFAFGEMDGDAISTTQASVVQCRPRIEAVNLNITLLIPSLQIDPTSIPSPIDSTRHTLYDGTLGIPTNVDNDVVPSDMNLYLPLNPSGQSPSIDFGIDSNSDGLFLSMIEGLNGTAPEVLATNPEALIEGIQRVYGIAVAQLMDLGGRQAYPTSTTTDLAARPTLQANLVNARLVRLQQSVVSTRIIQGLLAAMVLCAIATKVLMRGVTRVVPKNPYTIAATWSLLAGSKVLEEEMVPLGAEWCDDKQLKERGVFEGQTFRLGWCEEKVGENREDVTRRFGININDS